MTKQVSEIYWMYDIVVPVGEGKDESIQPVNNNNNNNNNNNSNNNNNNNNNNNINNN